MLRDGFGGERLAAEKVGGPSVKPRSRRLMEAVGFVGTKARFTADTGHAKCIATCTPSGVHVQPCTSAPTTLCRPRLIGATAPTSLQALLLMNETQFVECALRPGRSRTLKEGGTKGT